MSVASSYSYWLHPRIIESWLLLALPLSHCPLPSFLMDSGTQEAHLVRPLGLTDEETETQKGEEPGPRTPGSWPSQDSIPGQQTHGGGFSHSPSRLWFSSSESPKATHPKSSGAWKWGDSLSGFLGHPLPISEGRTGRCPCVESQGEGEAPPPGVLHQGHSGAEEPQLEGFNTKGQRS